jgi:hypothetical protein
VCSRKGVRRSKAVLQQSLGVRGRLAGQVVGPGQPVARRVVRVGKLVGGHGEISFARGLRGPVLGLLEAADRQVVGYLQITAEADFSADARIRVPRCSGVESHASL